MAKGAAAPVESPTVSAARPATTIAPQPQDEAETVLQERSNPGAKRRRALLGVALLAAAGAGLAAAVAFGLGGDPEPTAQTTPSPTATATATPTATSAELRVEDELTIGDRPNVVRAYRDNVFVGSFRQQRLRIVSAKTGKIRSFAPRIGVGVNDGAFGFGSLWLAVGRENRIVRLDQRTGRPRGNPISVPGPPGAVAASKNAVWVALVPGQGAPDTLLKLDPSTGNTLASVEYPYGIGSLTVSPSALWVAARRRAQIQRVSLETGQIVRSLRVGRNRTEDLAYRNGALWAAVPEDNTVYKVATKTGDRIPISVGQQPRQLALGDGVVYVSNYSSSDLYTIDEKGSRKVGDPVDLSPNPFSMAVDASGKTLWVGSQPEDKLSTVLTGRGE